MTIALFINNFINRYIILYDTEKLLTKANITLTEICTRKKVIKINNSSYNCEFTSVKEINKNHKKKEELSLWNFFIYKLSFGKKYNNVRMYEAFRETVISVESLIKNHLNIMNLLKFNKIDKIK